MHIVLQKRFYIIIAALFVFIVLVLTVLSLREAEKGKPLAPNKIKTTSAPIPTNYESFPEATKQEYPSQTSNKTGTLIVNSNPSGVKVIVDSPKSDAPEKYPQIPENITPFKISNIPEGTYFYFASKDGFDFTEGKFEIKEGEITSVFFELVPL